MLGNYLITEDTTMKAFKKLMAAALVCVMALTMLTGCGIADKKSAKNMVEALNDAAKAAKVNYTYERTDAMDKIAQAAMKNAQNGKDIKKATVNGSYEIYTVKLSDTWNSVSDLKKEAEKAHAAFAAANPVVKSSKVSVGIEVDKVEKDNYMILVVEKAK